MQDITWAAALPRNPFSRMQASLRLAAQRFDASHQRDAELRAECTHAAGTIEQTAGRLYCAVRPGRGPAAYGTAAALALAPVRTEGFAGLMARLRSMQLLLDKSEVVGAVSFDVCTGLSGPAALCGTLLPEAAFWSAAPPAPLVLARDVCADGPSEHDASELFVESTTRDIVGPSSTTTILG